LAPQSNFSELLEFKAQLLLMTCSNIMPNSQSQTLAIAIALALALSLVLPQSLCVRSTRTAALCEYANACVQCSQRLRPTTASGVLCDALPATNCRSLSNAECPTTTTNGQTTKTKTYSYLLPAAWRTSTTTNHLDDFEILLNLSALCCWIC